MRGSIWPIIIAAFLVIIVFVILIKLMIKVKKRRFNTIVKFQENSIMPSNETEERQTIIKRKLKESKQEDVNIHGNLEDGILGTNTTSSDNNVKKQYQLIFSLQIVLIAIALTREISLVLVPIYIIVVIPTIILYIKSIGGIIKAFILLVSTYILLMKFFPHLFFGMIMAYYVVPLLFILVTCAVIYRLSHIIKQLKSKNKEVEK